MQLKIGYLFQCPPLFIARYFKAFALSGRIVDCHYTQGDALG